MAQKVAVALLTGDALSKLIGRIGRASANLTKMIQEAAVQCIAQSIIHRNATPAAQLFDAVGSSARRDALVQYFEMFGNLTWSKGEKKVIFVDMEKIPNGRKLAWTDEYAEKVAETLWFKVKAETQPKSIFDVEEEAQKFLERLSKAKGRGAELKNAGLLDRLLDTYRQFVGEQYLKATTALPTAEDVKVAAEAGKASAEKLQALQETFGGRPTKVAAGASK